MAGSNGSVYQLNEDPDFHFQILRALATGSYDGADASEVLTAAQTIQPQDFESFFSAFSQVANHVYDRAKAVMKNRFPVSARSAFFSAATYFRAAEFYLHGNQSDPRIYDLWDMQTAAFDQGLALLSTPNSRVTVKADGFDVPAIWLTPDDEVKQRPTIIMSNGYDGAQEEMYHFMGIAALERGYNVLTYEGPGQPTVRREQNIGFIPDWERVVTPVVDYALSLTDLVDPDAIALVGLSFAGYLAPRAAAFEHRLAAVMAVDGVWDFGAVVRQSFGPEAMAVYDSGDRDAFDALSNKFRTPDVPTALRWGLEQGLWTFNTTSAYDFVTLSRNFTMEPVAHLVKTPVFVGAAEGEPTFRGQPEKLAAALGEYAHLYQFTFDDYIGAHAGLGALKQQNQVLLDWFQEILDGK